MNNDEHRRSSDGGLQDLTMPHYTSTDGLRAHRPQTMSVYFDDLPTYRRTYQSAYQSYLQSLFPTITKKVIQTSMLMM